MREIDDQTTPPPWVCEHPRDMSRSPGPSPSIIRAGNRYPLAHCYGNNFADGDFIVFARNHWSALIAAVNWKEEALPLFHRYSELAMSFEGKLGSSTVDNLERGVAKLREQATRVSELEVNNERLRKLLFRVVSHCNDETIMGMEMITDIRAEIG